MEQNGSAARWDLETRRNGISQLRQRAGLTQTTLARLAGISRYTLTRFESGLSDVKDRTMTALEEALSDVLAGQKTTAALRAERTQTGRLAALGPPPRGTEERGAARERFVRQGGRTMTQLRLENAKLSEQVGIMRDMMQKLREQVDNLNEITTLQSEAIKQFEAEEPRRPKEVDGLLRRAAAVAKR